MHWYRNIFSHVPGTKVREIAAMLKAIHAGEDIAAAREKAIRVIEKLRGLLLALQVLPGVRGINFGSCSTPSRMQHGRGEIGFRSPSNCKLIIYYCGHDQILVSRST